MDRSRLSRRLSRKATISRVIYLGAIFFSMVLFSGLTVMAQTTSFTYQGKLTDSGSPANGSYDLQFTLWDSLNAGIQQPQPTPFAVTKPSVGVSGGVFTVQLDFGVSVFPGADRFLEIGVKPTGGGSFTILSPRQQISSTPYAIRTLSATSADSLSNACVACVQDSQINQVAGSKVNGTIPLAAVPNLSSNYIQNSTSQQSGDFNISGNGTAGGTLSATNIGLGTPTPTGRLSIRGAGTFNANGAARLDIVNTTANTGFVEHVTDVGLWQLATTGNLPRMVVDPGGNVGIQTAAPGANFTVAQSSTGPGTISLVTGSNTVIGTNTQFTNTFKVGDAIAGTAIPAGTTVTSISSDTSMAVSAGATATVSNVTYFDASGGPRLVVKGYGSVGIGTSTPTNRLAVIGGPLWTTAGWLGAMEFSNASALAWQANAGGWHFGIGQTNNGLFFFRSQSNLADTSNPANYFMTMTDLGLVGINTVSPDATLSVNGSADKPGGGSWTSFSDERLKNINGRYTSGLKAVMQLQPLRYEYKRDNALGIKSDGQHIGFSAQAVQKIIPEAVTQNNKGYLLVNNDPILWTMLNAIKEQQAQIAQQQKQIVGLKKLVCRAHRQVAGCR